MLIGNSKTTNKIIYGPAVAVDTVILSIIKERLNVLLIKVGSGPYKGDWAIPGGLVQLNESLDDAAVRVLNQNANIKKLHLEQLYTFGDPKRDKRGQIISVSYFLLLPNPEAYEIKTLEYYKAIKWHPITTLPIMAFDHKKIVNYAYERLKSKMEYSTIAYSLLPELFTLTQMQKVYEAVWGNKIDKRNFRKRISNLGIIEKTDKVDGDSNHRPAQLYKFRDQELKIID